MTEDYAWCNEAADILNVAFGKFCMLANAVVILQLTFLYLYCIHAFVYWMFV